MRCFNKDPSNRQFAAGCQSNWSYPSWPSHIDHLLIANELPDNLIEVKTLRMNDCLSSYDPDISDHLPVISTFRKHLVSFRLN